MIVYPELPFATDSLEPYMSAWTLDFHYGKHHKKYVDTANELIKGTIYETLDIETILLDSYLTDTEIFNNTAQAWNHTFFWNCLRADSEPSKRSIRALKSAFGSLENLKEVFARMGNALFGSGWVWLVRDIRGSLRIRALCDAENPLIMGEVPILTCDVWEHAYYLDYQNDRAAFLKNFWRIVNWDFIEENFDRKPPQVPERGVFLPM